jgi:hypothetical protein
VSLLVFAACSSDDSGEHTDNVTSDAGADASKPDDKPKPSDNTKDAGKDSGGDKPGKSDTGMNSGAGGCKDVSCNAPATCEDKDGKASCKCPDGYEDTKGDGSECKDIDECNGDERVCNKNAHCKNTDGGYECECKAPAYAGDGKDDCHCADGFKEKDGECVAPDGNECSDNSDCENGHCVSGICCASACTSPDQECYTDKGATCEDGKTCKYKVAEDGADCDDSDACADHSTCKAGKCQHGDKPHDCDDKNPCTDDSCDAMLGCHNQNNAATCDDGNACTTNDKCNNGTCSEHTDVDCTASADACNEGKCDPKDGACKKAPRADGMSCDDANSCTMTDVCMGGACTGASACGPNATGCTQGSPNTCTCKEQFHASNGVCVPDNDECASNPCGANATCFDPSNNAGDVQCTCPKGYTGDGKTGCTLTHPCESNNPCGEGRGTCTEGANGSYTCACAAGFVSVNNTCVCNLMGTFAVRQKLDLSWPAQETAEAGMDSQYSWTIHRMNYDTQGNVQIEIVPCGETNVDLCGEGVATIPAEAYAQYVPAAVWDRANAASTTVSMSLPAPLPNSKFETPVFASLEGIALDNPMGDWPASRKDVQGDATFDGSATNGARWIDFDNDGVNGLTTVVVGPQGAPADGSALAPVEGYGTTSQVCPRSNPNAAREPYNYVPAIDGLSIRRVKRFSAGNRVISQYSGTINSCDAISGEVVGPDNGRAHFDTRIQGCTRVNGSGETACSDTIVDFLDSSNSSTQKVEANTFSMKRVADNSTCAQVRATTF